MIIKCSFHLCAPTNPFTFHLKFNVNVTIPIANIEECWPCLVTTADWSDHHIPVSDWLIDIPNASGQTKTPS